MASKLTRVIALFYTMQTEDIAKLQTALVNQMTKAWRRGIEDEEKQFGSQMAKASPPRGRDLEEMKRLAKRDAESIAKTFNRNVENHLERLYIGNPKGNRHYYIRQMELWIQQRNAWKNPQIALMTEGNIRGYARSRFWEENNVGKTFRMYPLTATCKVCTQIIAKGNLTRKFIENHPAPIHIGCIHEYRVIENADISCRRMWVGD